MSKVKIQIKDQMPAPAEVESKKDFKKLVYRYQKDTRPLYKIKLYKYKNRFYFLAVLIILLIAYLIYESFQ